MYKRFLKSALVAAVMVLCLAGRAGAASVLSFDVTCDDKKVGKITIDQYDKYNSGDFYGVSIKGGFDAATGPGACVLEKGAQYRWIQAYIGEPTLYSWEDKAKWSYDRTRDSADDKKIKDGSPFYVNLRGPGYGHTTLGYFDQPTDKFTATVSKIEYLFQTALVCYEEGKNGKKGEIHLIDGFTWGLKWVKPAATRDNPTPDPVYTATNPTHSKDHFADLIKAFNDDPDKATLSDRYTISEGCCCVPLPSAAGQGVLVLALIGGVAGMRRYSQAA